MPRHLILIVCSHDARRQARYAAIRGAGYRPLPAPTVQRALALLQTVRPDLVLADADLADGRAHALVRQMRATAALEKVIAMVLGRVTAQEYDDLAVDSYVHLHYLDDEDDHDTLVALLDGVLSGARAAGPSWADAYPETFADDDLRPLRRARPQSGGTPHARSRDHERTNSPP